MPSPERPTLRITEGEASGSGGARGGGGGGAGTFGPVIKAEEQMFFWHGYIYIAILFITLLTC